MRDLKFACPHCEQHIQCEDSLIGQTIKCPTCGRAVPVPKLPDEHHLRVTTGCVPIPTHAHGAPRAADAVVPEPPPAPKPRTRYSRYAIASLTLAVSSLLFGPFGCIPAIVFGHLAQIELRHQPFLEGASLARAGLIVGYCFLALFTLIGILVTLRLTKMH
jgi:hypothetical protein